MSKYSDKRSDFFKDYFEKGLTYEEYLKNGEEKHSTRWRDFEARMELTSEQQERLRSFKRQMNIIVMSGVWCGDCVRQGPMLNLLGKTQPLLNFRFVESRENPELQEELRVLGGARVPVAVLLSEDFFEVARFGDRTLSAYRRKTDTELGPACDAGLVAPGAGELSKEINDWIDILERGQLMLRLSPMLRERHAD